MRGCEALRSAAKRPLLPSLRSERSHVGKQVNQGIPKFKPKPEHLAKLGFLAKNRVYDQTFRNLISERLGFTVYVYDISGKLINTYPSIIKFKEAYGIKLHHKTLYKKISQGILINGLKISLAPLQNNQSSSIIPSSDSVINQKLKPRKIQLTNTVKSELSQFFESLSSAAAYIKKVDGKCDKSTLRKYINSDKLYRKIWKVIEIK
jgi:hypothetical protein